MESLKRHESGRRFSDISGSDLFTFSSLQVNAIDM